MANLSCKAILCEKTSVDPRTQLLSIQNIVNRVFVTISPEESANIGKERKLVKMPIEIVLFWKRTQNDRQEINATFEVHFCDPDGNIMLNNMKAEVHMTSSMELFYSIIKLDSLPCEGPGRHQFRVLQKNDVGTEEVLCEELLEIQMVDQQGHSISS